MMVDRQGLILCGRYAFGPNSLHYCGPERQNDMLGYVVSASVDRGLIEILNHFETLYPYLVLIASENYIKDPFDRRVIEAYWLGNNLLGGVKLTAFATHIADTLELKKKIPKKKFTPMMDRVITGVPQHNFHVMNIFMRTGHHAALHTISTMDSCRISWGRVEEIHVGKHLRHCVVRTQPLVYTNHKLHLGVETTKVVSSVSVEPQKGQWVSLHWGYICDVLTSRQLMFLKKYTALAIHGANQAL